MNIQFQFCYMLKNNFKFKFSSNRWFKAMFFNFLCYLKNFIVKIGFL